MDISVSIFRLEMISDLDVASDNSKGIEIFLPLCAAFISRLFKNCDCSRASEYLKFQARASWSIFLALVEFGDDAGTARPANATVTLTLGVARNPSKASIGSQPILVGNSVSNIRLIRL